MKRSRGLGRGLDALIPSAPEETQGGDGVDAVDVDLIVPNPHQPRVSFSDESIAELAASIREHGVIQPLLVSRAHPEGVYQLIAGERRLRAARLAGLQRVPVVVREAASRELLELALVENLQRADLNPIEEALAYRRLADEFDMTQDAIATRVGRSRASVANAMRLLTLSEELKSSVASGEITEGHARALLSIESPDARRAVWERVKEAALTVRQTEEMARRKARATNATTPHEPEPDTLAVESRLRDALGTKVDLRHAKGGSGRLVIHYYSNEELESLLARLGVELT
jgi:ParB family transcriptional regulator, chromosome partitioning protein